MTARRERLSWWFDDTLPPAPHRKYNEMGPVSLLQQV